MEGREVVSPPEVQSNVIDLMDALKASVEAAKAGKEEAGEKTAAKKARTKTAAASGESKKRRTS